jgi:hypothetical protein
MDQHTYLSTQNYSNFKFDWTLFSQAILSPSTGRHQRASAAAILSPAA